MGQKDKSFCTCLDRGHYEATGKQKGNGIGMNKFLSLAAPDGCRRALEAEANSRPPAGTETDTRQPYFGQFSKF